VSGATGTEMVLPGWGSGWDSGQSAADAVRALNARSALVDGVEPISGHVLQAVTDGSAHTLLVRAADLAGELGDNAVGDDGTLAGVAVAAGSDPAEALVAPELRRRGVGRALVRAVLDRQGAVWAYGNLPAAAALARRLGLVRTRELLQLRRTSTARDRVELPDGVRIRTFVPGRDDRAFLAVNARAFAWHPEQGRLDEAGLQAEMSQDWFHPAGFFLAVSGPPDAERVLGFHWTKVHPVDPTPGADPEPADGPTIAADGPTIAAHGAQPPGPVGEIYVLGVDPESPVRGLGTPLTAAGLNYLAGRGLHTVMLYVEADNAPALKLYRRFGFSTAVSNVVYARPADRYPPSPSG
jgi:mycothiol synthase